MKMKITASVLSLAATLAIAGCGQPHHGPSNAEVTAAVRATFTPAAHDAMAREGIKITGIVNHGCKLVFGYYLCTVEVDATRNGVVRTKVSTIRITKTKTGWVAG